MEVSENGRKRRDLEFNQLGPQKLKCDVEAVKITDTLFKRTEKAKG